MFLADYIDSLKMQIEALQVQQDVLESALSAQEENIALLAMLKELEWSYEYWFVDGYQSSCPSCRGLEYEGHKPGCKLAALLKEDTHDKRSTD